MSSEIVSTEDCPEKKNQSVAIHVRLKMPDVIYFRLLEESKRLDRSVSYLISKILEVDYEENSKPKVV